MLLSFFLTILAFLIQFGAFHLKQIKHNKTWGIRWWNRQISTTKRIEDDSLTLAVSFFFFFTSSSEERGFFFFSCVLMPPLGAGFCTAGLVEVAWKNRLMSCVTTWLMCFSKKTARNCLLVEHNEYEYWMQICCSTVWSFHLLTLIFQENVHQLNFVNKTPRKCQPLDNNRAKVDHNVFRAKHLLVNFNQ